VSRERLRAVVLAILAVLALVAVIAATRAALDRRVASPPTTMHPVAPTTTPVVTDGASPEGNR
jgi:hypothetical protein